MALNEGWSAPATASHLVEAVGGDQTVLRQARARILRGTAERSTPFAERAIATLDLALEGEAAVR